MLFASAHVSSSTRLSWNAKQITCWTLFKMSALHNLRDWFQRQHTAPRRTPRQIGRRRRDSGPAPAGLEQGELVVFGHLNHFLHLARESHAAVGQRTGQQAGHSPRSNSRGCAA